MSTLSTQLQQQADQAAVNAMRSGALDEQLVSALVDRQLYGAELAAQRRIDNIRLGSKPSTMAFILCHPMQVATAAIVGAAVLFCGAMATTYGGGSAIEAVSTTRSR